MGDTITEHPAQSPGKSASADSRAAQVFEQPPARDPDLLLIIGRWDSLTTDQKRRIIEVAGEEIPNTTETR